MPHLSTVCRPPSWVLWRRAWQTMPTRTASAGSGPMSSIQESGLAVLAVRYTDLETRDFLRRVRSALNRAAPEDNREISKAIRSRVRGARPDAFRIVSGPHPGWREDVALVYAYLITAEGLPTRQAVAGFVQLWWELDSTETHELVLVMVDGAGNETPLRMADLALGYDAVHGSSPPCQDEASEP